MVNDAAEYTASVLAPVVMPAGVEFVPMADILKKRAALIEERTAFRSCLEEFAHQVSQIEDGGHRKELNLEPWASRYRSGDRGGAGAQVT